ncbi:unnamed protein product [Arabidopsis halleri]
MRFAIESMIAKRFLRRNHFEKCVCCWRRALSGKSSYNYRQKLSRNALLDLKLDDVVALFNEMVISRPFPSIIEFSKLLSAIAKMKKFDVVISLGYTVTYNTLIQGLFQAGDCDMAQETFSQMESFGVSPDLWAYNILLDGLCNNGRLEKALVVFECLQKSEMELDIFTYNIMIEGMCKDGKVEDGWGLFCSLSLKGVKPDVITYNTMISGLCRNGLNQEAYALLTKMKQDGPPPDSGTYNTLIRACLRDGDKAASAELIKEMRSCGFAGDASAIGLVANMLHDGRLDKSFLEMLS